MFVPTGYVKLEGGTVSRENYPRLVALADAYNLWTSDTTNNPGLFGEGDGATTMVLPNWTGRMEQFAATAGGKIDAGLPNITGVLHDQASNTSAPYFIKKSGAFYSSILGERYYWSKPSNNNTDQFFNISFDASLSNPIYANSTTVQPPAINVFAIMRY